MSNYSEKIYGVRFGYFNSNNNFILHNECKFNDLDDIKLQRFKQDYIYFKDNSNVEKFIFHFYKTLESTFDEKFFLWVGVSAENFDKLMDSVTINSNENINRISSFNSFNINDDTSY